MCRVKKLALVKGLLTCLCVLLFSGCPAFLLGGAAAGAAGAYYLGELTATRNTTLTQAWLASESALEELGIVVISKERDGLTGVIYAKGAEEKTIRIHLKKIFDDVTEIKVRVGTLGDEMQSRIILERIENYLTSPRPGTIHPELPS